jgi:outer membrane lipoprotein carrier protein
MKLLISLLTLSTLLSANIDLPKNFKTDFNQTITNEKGKVIQYDGKVFFKNIDQLHPDAMAKKITYTRSIFKWSYLTPTQKEVCTDGTQLIVVDHDLEQISSYMINDGINLKEILKIAKKISQRDYQATYKEVEYLISLDDAEQLKQIVYVDNLDNAVKIIFKNMNYNTVINQNDLDCNAPDVYDVIKG